MKTICELRNALAAWIDDAAIRDLKRAWHLAVRADIATTEGRRMVALVLYLAHGYYISRSDQRGAAAETIRPTH